MTTYYIKKILSEYGFSPLGSREFVMRNTVNGVEYRAYIGGIGSPEYCYNNMLCVVEPINANEPLGAGVLKTEAQLIEALQKIPNLTLLPLVVQKDGDGNYTAITDVDMGSFVTRVTSNRADCPFTATTNLRNRLLREQEFGTIHKFDFVLINQAI